MMIKSPLRYPGGKSKALKMLLPLVPEFQEFREPFLGGGSVFLALKQIYPNRNFWINDLNHGLFSFWHVLKTQPKTLIEEIQKQKDIWKNGRALFYKLVDIEPSTEFESAVRFFLLNRITFSGTVEAGGYSEAAFNSRFTQSSIKRLSLIPELLFNTAITNLDYAQVVSKPGEGVFIFLDPPYLSATQSRLYGKNGFLHTSFDHQRFAKVMRACRHKWMITYDDSEEIRGLFNFANVISWEFQYGMNNYKQGSARKGKEIIITNYDLDAVKPNEFEPSMPRLFD